MKIIKNCIQCKACGEMVESKSRHAFLTCSYGGVVLIEDWSISGGYRKQGLILQKCCNLMNISFYCLC